MHDLHVNACLICGFHVHRVRTRVGYPRVLLKSVVAVLFDLVLRITAFDDVVGALDVNQVALELGQEG